MSILRIAPRLHFVQDLSLTQELGKRGRYARSHILIIPSEAYIPPESPTSGIFQRDQALILKDAGFRIGIISPNLKSLRFIPKRSAWGRFGYHYDDTDGIPAYSFDGWNWSVKLHQIIGWRWVRKGMFLFKKYILSEGLPDIVHCHNALYAGKLARLIKKDFEIPYVLTEHSSAYAEGFYPTSFHQEVRDAYRGAANIIAVSPRLGELLDCMFKGVEKDWKWIPNVVDSLFEDQPIPSKPKEDDISTILSIGNLDENKNHEGLIKAFANRFKGDANIRLRIGGEGPLLNHLIYLARELGVANQLNFLGYIDRTEVLKEMDSCDIVVLSSHYETFGVVFIEALSRGIPVVATACGGPECIVHNGNGILVPTNDPSALGNAMEQMFKTIDNYDARRIRADALAMYGRNAVRKQLSKVYAQVMKCSVESE